MSSCATPGQKRRLFKDAGRACPIDYRIPEDAFAGAPQLEADVLYVVGGLYGNPFALDAIDEMVRLEEEAADAGADAPPRVLVVLNGDTHWFDKTAENFAALERRMGGNPSYVPMVGNVEAELRRQEDVGVGCGCAYPECTDDASVARSNRIHKMLSIAVDAHPELKRMLDGRPGTATVFVAGRKVAVTHGDEKLLGGWDCSRESLQDILRQDEVDSFMAENDIDVFATTHTCAPAAIRLARGAVVNNGAAGLPNFAGQRYGLCIRIAAAPVEDSLFETELDGLFVQAVPVRYDHDAYLEWFDGLWDAASPAAISYRSRILNGPDDRLADSLLGGFVPGATARAEAAGEARVAGASSVEAADVADVVGSRAARAARATDSDVRLALEGMLYFDEMLPDDAFRMTDENPKTIQANMTAKCNLACKHCHVESNPMRTEAMGRDVLEAILKVARDRGIETIDVTGGAPEMHPDFEWFLREAAACVPRVMVRSNLVILKEAEYSRFLDLYVELGIEVVGSLPNVFAAEADAQRGRNVYDATVDVLRELNAQGYGSDGRHVLDLVFNPQEPILPPLQEEVEEVYRRRLGNLGIAFDNLFAVANNPIGRYGQSLLNDGSFEPYMETLLDSFNPDTCEGMMCRHQLSVGWDGGVYDCDFNQALGMRACGSRLPEGEVARSDVDRALLGAGRPSALTIFDYANDPSRPLRRPIVFGNHCYACTAGFGSSCGGTLVQE